MGTKVRSGGIEVRSRGTEVRSGGIEVRSGGTEVRSRGIEVRGEGTEVRSVRFTMLCSAVRRAESEFGLLVMYTNIIQDTRQIKLTV